MTSASALQLPDDLSHDESEAEAESFTVQTNRAPADRDPLTRSSEQLLQAIAAGNKSALGLLFRKHGRTVSNVAWRILRDRSEADDLRQEIFLHIYLRAHLYDPSKCSAASWIMQVAYHRAFDRRRFLNVRRHYKAEILDEERVGPTAPSLSTDNLDGQLILRKMRDQLSPEQQQTLELYFFEGYTFREIAEKSGQTLGNVRHHYYRALERLRSNLFSKERNRSERIG